MSLSQAQKKAFRSIGHHLNPVVTLSENGISENLVAELNRALNDHELIKIKLAIAERDDRAAMLEELLAQAGNVERVQTIGKTALLYRKNPKANVKLSNVSRFENHHGRH
ncbi:YhbY family RNA-binding protein [Halomonas dongshanensis]|uniref:YhbY family RNA-binding protein n=1 Tax=Halomonas dongshanensis TaxID=2890835 RepID=A0ABT2E9H0_9GAMM|nr:YhbY family RNA-binding protein [Halomonas dongshanensis]MCS2608230.1 YhbY family RNA-binding protein [Halomonas dongshanensis]